MATIFLSYSRKDTKIMRRVKETLEQAGVSVWIDEDLRPGTDDWVRAIELNLRQCRGVVVLLSPDAYKSRWVQRELSRADKLKRTIFPLLARGRPTSVVPFLIETVQFIDIRSDLTGGMTDLIAEFETRGWCGLPEWVIEPELSVEPPSEEKEPRPFEETSTTTTKENPAGIEWVNIPAGEFLYGDDKERKYIRKDYLIGKYPVTNAQYKLFLDANPEYHLPRDWDKDTRTHPRGKANHPVVNVSWDDVSAFCKWGGYRLPTQQEWEKAARGEDGRTYPWGEDWVDGKYCNSEEASIGRTTPIDDFPEGVSPYGVWDIAGNVWEWTSGWYDKEKKQRVVRGGSFFDDQSYAGCAFRDWSYPDFRSHYGGFRVVVSP
jgi:formylglycine-generating enzyme required for sulfatase activity